ncbi:hypothetical protein XHV734_p0011 (plasmid) [Xanthomonas hortorum pv. vitians]|nr:hypothetical protein XHV734_p0011 [Xanthomonas hortorum pv. vitians]
MGRSLYEKPTSGRALAIAPAFGELQAGAAVDDVPTGCRQFVGIHMPAVDEQLRARSMACGLSDTPRVS